MNTRQKAFNLAELLIALAVLALVFGLIAVWYVSAQKNAMWAAAEASENNFNKNLDQWKSSGGSLTGNTYTSDLLDMMASSSAYSKNGVADSGNSQGVRMSIFPTAQTTTALGNQEKRAVYLDNTQQFLADYNFITGYFGVVPVMNGGVPFSYWGTGDSSRTIYHEAIGKTTTIIMQKADNLITMYEPLTFSWNLTNSANAFSGTLQQGLESGEFFVSSQQQSNIGPNPNPSLNCSIAHFTNQNGQPAIAEVNNIQENFFNDNNPTAANDPNWVSALANLQATDAPVTVVQ